MKDKMKQSPVLCKSSFLVNIFFSMRPKQWIKNLFGLTPIMYSKNVFVFPLNIKVFMAFLLFCMVSGCVYIINDVADVEKDKVHPRKRQRPIASGAISHSKALGAAGVVLILSLIGGYIISNQLLAILAIYFLMNLTYSIVLKHVVLLDVFVIAIGFVLRVVGGGVAINVELSSWLLLCTLFIALFMALCKRRQELVLLDKEASNHRTILGEYSPYFIDQLIAVVTASTLVSYALYTMSENVLLKFGNNNLKYTVPFVLYGIFRYLFLVHQKDKGESPTEIMLSDVPILVNMGLWFLVVSIVLYF